MSSGHHPANYHLQDASEYHGDPMANAPMHSDALNLEHFMMNNHDHNSPDPALLATPPQLDVLQHHEHQFGDFSFPYSDIPDNNIHGERQMGNHHQAYNIGGHDPNTSHRGSMSSIPGDHRNSIASMSGDHRPSITSMAAHRASLSNATGPARHNSTGGVSDVASPASNRAGGGNFGDDFGLSAGAAVDGSDLGTRPKEDKNDATPAWTELKTKAGKERKRLPLACIACRRKKIRCSGEKPACKHCIRSRVPCVYKVTTRKAAPRTDYMAMLDKRLKRMEDRIIKIVPVEEQAVTTALVARANVKPAIPGTTSPTAATKKRAADDTLGPDFDDWAQAPSASNIDAAKPPSLMIQEAEESKLLAEGAELLPPKEIQEHLAEIYFSTLYGQTYHLLHKPSYMRKLR